MPRRVGVRSTRERSASAGPTISSNDGGSLANFAFGTELEPFGIASGGYAGYYDPEKKSQEPAEADSWGRRAARSGSGSRTPGRIGAARGEEEEEGRRKGSGPTGNVSGGGASDSRPAASGSGGSASDGGPTTSGSRVSASDSGRSASDSAPSAIDSTPSASINAMDAIRGSRRAVIPETGTSGKTFLRAVI